MMNDIKKVAVIGAGVMGASIAAHVANAGVPVVLLDIVARDNPNRSAIAEGAIDAQGRPGAFYAQCRRQIRDDRQH
jgi:3-hydroxyacyl-CoA dehydrogenase